MNKDKRQYHIGTLLRPYDLSVEDLITELSEFRKLMNGMLAEIICTGAVSSEDMTAENIQPLTRFDASLLITSVVSRYETESKNITNFGIRRDFLKIISSVESNLLAIVSDAQRRFKAMHLRTSGDDFHQVRQRFVRFNAGTFHMDSEEIRAAYLRRITSNAQAAFLLIAQDLYERIQSFNEECARLSHGAVAGVGHHHGGGSIIMVGDDGAVYFDEAQTADFQFYEKRHSDMQ